MIYRFNDCELNSERVLLKRSGRTERIEPQAFAVLMYLIAQRGRVVTRDELLDEIWGHEYISESTLSSSIKAVRKAVGDDGTRQGVIRTVHGKGYEFVAAIDELTAPEPAATQTASPTLASTQLPSALQSLIGRRQLLDQIRVELHTNRLVTLVGPGGVGKTALAYELARSTEQRYADGVFVVELVTVRSPESTVEAIATALRVHTRQDDTLDNAVVDHLQAREALLLLDNCEHVVDAVGAIVERVTQIASRVTVLATSREALAIKGERVWPVEPLACAVSEADEADVERLSAAPAVALFVERARAADPLFVLDTSNARDVNEVCRRLDGMPLAIELAAARSRALGVAGIAQRLDQRFRVLKGARRGTDPRHQTLHDTVRWSYELLSPDEKTFFAELSVFAGPFDLDAAEAVCGADEEVDVLSLTTRLAERSMITVRRAEDGATRYELLDTLRAFGREQLDPEHSLAMFARHASHYRALSETVEQGLENDNEKHCISAADAAFADLRAAYRQSLNGETSEALAIVCALREYAMRTMRYEALTWADSALLAPGADEHPAYATVLAIQAYGAWLRGEFDKALSLAHTAAEEEQRRELQPSGLAERVLANVFYVKGDTERGMAASSRQLVLAEQSDNRSRLAHACYMHAIAISSIGDEQVAAECAERARVCARETGSPTDTASALTAIGFVSHRDPQGAVSAFSDAQRIAARAGNRWMTMFARTEMSRLLLEQGDLEEARGGLAEVIDVWFRAGEWSQQWLTLTGCVVALFEMGRHDLACHAIGAMQGRTVLGALPVTPGLRVRALEAAGALERKLGSEQYAALTGRGAQLPVTEVVHSIQVALRE